jgi:septal ring factor EnvC (AmiA/AmiB activator)
MPKSTPDLS